MASRQDVVTVMQAKLAAAGKTGATKKECEELMDITLASLEEVVMGEGEGTGTVRTVIGTFKRRDVAARTARNPRTGEPVEVDAKSLLAFKAAAPKVEAPVAKPAKKAAAKPAAKAAPVKAGKKVLKKK